MHTIEIPEANKTLYLPGHLGECDKWQYINMCGLIFQFQAGQISYGDLKYMAVYKLLNLKPSKKKQLITDEENMWVNVYEVAKLVDNFFEDINGQKVIRQEYVYNPVPKFRPLWVNYHGPSDSFMNVTFGEYLDGLRLFLDFSATGDIKLLYLLAAVFYRRAKYFHYIKKHKADYNGDIREPYNSKTIDKRASKFQYAPMGFIYGFFLYFASFQKYITGAAIQWGGKVIDFSILFDSENKSEDTEAVPGIGMDSLAFALAESGEFGNLEAVRDTNLWEVLIRMYDLRKKDLDYKLKEKLDAKS